MSEEFPKMLYSVNGSTVTVHDALEEVARVGEGFSERPFDIHREIKSGVPANTLEKPVAASTPTDPFGIQPFLDAFEERLIDRIRREFFADAADEMKPRRGRPPKAASLLSDQE